MTGPVFVDTNVFVHLHDDSEPEKKQRADDWVAFLVKPARRPSELPGSAGTLRRAHAHGKGDASSCDGASHRPRPSDIVAWRPTPIDLSILERAWAIEQRYTLSWWDSLIVAAAQRSQCKVVLTEDLQDGQVFGAVRVIDSFASPERTPAELLGLSAP